MATLMLASSLTRMISYRSQVLCFVLVEVILDGKIQSNTP